MSNNFSFCAPSIHRVINITAELTKVEAARKFSCVTIVFHGADGETQEVEAYFSEPEIHKAEIIAAAINQASGIKAYDDAEAA